MWGGIARASVGRMDRILLTIALVGGYFALAIAANVESPVEQAAAAALVAVPASADAAERWYETEGSGAARTADAAERALSSSFDRLPKPYALR